MNFQDKWSENGRNNIFRDKQVKNKVLVMFWDVKVFTEKWPFRFWPPSTKKLGTV